MLGADEDDGAAQLDALALLVPELCHHLPHLHHHHGGPGQHLLQFRYLNCATTFLISIIIMVALWSASPLAQVCLGIFLESEEENLFEIDCNLYLSTYVKEQRPGSKIM